MKRMCEINNLSELEKQRQFLLNRLSNQKTSLEHDLKKINAGWSKWLRFGSAIGNLAMVFVPKLNMLTIGFTLLKKLFGMKK